MSKTVGRLKEGDLHISGSIIERENQISNGLVVHYPFDESMNANHKTANGLKVLYYATNNQVNGHRFGNWFSNNGAIMTQTTNINGVSVAEAKNYDVILIDCYVWAVSNTDIDKAKEFADAGISVIATGNDTRTNYFASAYTASSTRGAHDIKVDIDAPIQRTVEVHSGIGSADIYGGIDSLQNGAKPLYYRTDENRITGYYYEGTSGAIFFFDQEGIVTVTELYESIMMWVINRSQSGVEYSSTTYTFNGLAVEEGTNNLSPYDGSMKSSGEGRHVGDIALSNGNSTTLGGGFRASTHYNDGICERIFTQTPYGEGYALRWIHGKTPGWKGITETQNWQADSAKTYTVSVYVRVNKKDSGVPSAYAFYGDTNNRYHFAWDKSPDKFPNEWVRGTLTFSPTVSQSGGIYLYGNTNGEEGLLVDYTGFQIEEKSYPTSYTDDSRSSGSLKLRCKAGTNFTILYKFTPNTSWYSYYTSSYGRRMMNMYDDVSGKKIWLQDYHGGGNRTDSDPWIGFDEYTSASPHWHNIKMKATAGVECWFALTKNGSTWTKYLLTPYSSSVQENSITKSDGNVDGFSLGSLSIEPDFCHSVKNVSVYDRALSKDEIVKIMNEPFSIQKNGDIKIHVAEKNNAIPMNSKYFQFGTDAMDEEKSMNPVKESDVSYGRRGVWVGNTTKNYAQYDITAYSSYYTYSRLDNSHYAYRHDSSTSSTLALQCPTFNSAISTGNTYTISGYLYLNGEPYKTTTPNLSTYHTQTLSSQSDENGYFEYTQVFNTSGWIIHSNICNAAIGDTIELRNLQIELNSYASEFTEKDRGDAELVLPYDIVDCKQDFTITGWFYPKLFADSSYRPYLTRNYIPSNYTGKRILIMGNGTTSTQLRAWFGSGGSETSVYAPTSVGVVTNTWNFFCLRRSGDVISLFAGVNGKIAYGTNGSGAYLNTDEDAANWGWLIGKYNGSSGIANGYASDYSFIQSALSDAEIEAIYRTQMRSKNNGVQIQGVIKERKLD